MPPWSVIAVSLYAGMSVIALAACACDKRAAARGWARVPERTLHVLELLGGWPGVLIGMAWLRHKNRKPSYWLITAGVAVAHAAGWLLVWRLGAWAN